MLQVNDIILYLCSSKNKYLLSVLQTWWRKYRRVRFFIYNFKDLISIFTPKTLEDNLIYKYWEKNKGSLFLEVPIGDNRNIWPKGSKVRKIDAIRVLDSNNEIYRSFSLERFQDIIKDKNIELIEAKQNLNRLVFGQIIAGIDMFIKQYKCKDIKGVILCEEGDPALEIICKDRGIKIIIV